MFFGGHSPFIKMRYRPEREIDGMGGRCNHQYKSINDDGQTFLLSWLHFCLPGPTPYTRAHTQKCFHSKTGTNAR